MNLTVDGLCNDLNICRNLADSGVPVYAQPFMLNILFHEDTSFAGKALPEAFELIKQTGAAFYRSISKNIDLYATRLRNMMQAQDIPNPFMTLPCSEDLTCRYAIRLANAIGADADLRDRHANVIDHSTIPMCFKYVVSYICDMRLTDSEYREIMSVILSTQPTEYWDVESIAKYFWAGPYNIEVEVWSPKHFIDFDPATKATPLYSRAFIDRLANKLEDMGGIYIPLSLDFNYGYLKTQGGMGFYQQLVTMADEIIDRELGGISSRELGVSIANNNVLLDYIQEAFHVKTAAEVVEIVTVLLDCCCEGTAVDGTLNKLSFCGPLTAEKLATI